MTRILYFTRDYTPHDHRFLSALAQTDDTILLLRLENSGRSLEDRPVPDGVQQIGWRGGLKPARWADYPALSLDLKRVIRQYQPDIIHAGPIQRVAFLAALAGFQPLVSMSWGSDLLREADQSRAWKWLTSYTLRRTTVLVGDCVAVRSKAADFGFDPANAVLFPWGVDLERFSPVQHPAQTDLRRRLGWQDKTVLLSLRSWEPLYGVDVILKAFMRAVQQRPDLRLILLGNGSQAGWIQRMIFENQLNDLVHLGGQVSNAALPAYYQSADLYLSASHSDGSSVSLMEALACGLPVWVSDIPGNLEWVSAGQVGGLFPDGDDQALAAGILQAAGDRPKLEAMRRAARQLAEERADWKKNFAKLGQAYDLALQMARKR